jgi:hypothetical protein
MNDQLASGIRTLLKFGAGLLVAKNVLPVVPEDVISALLLIIGMAWSYYHHHANPTKVQTDSK